MELGQAVYVISRLFMGALASFLAIILWSKTRDVAWMLVIIGAIAAYADTIYAVLSIFGIVSGSGLSLGAMPVMAIFLPILPTIFFIAAFSVMVTRKFRRR